MTDVRANESMHSRLAVTDPTLRNSHTERILEMNTRFTSLAALLVAGGASLAIAAAPSALANPGLVPSCEATEAGGGAEGGMNTLCEQPGNAELNARPSVLAPGAMGGMGGGGIGGGI